MLISPTSVPNGPQTSQESSRHNAKRQGLSGPRKLAGIQCLRAVAAAAVVLCHLEPFEGKYEPGAILAPHALEFGMYGVDIFFVISGFIIATVTAGRFRRQGEPGRFLMQRASRIFPIYWVYFLAVLAIFLVHPEWVNSEHGRPDLIRSFLLLPQQNLPLLLVSWTLVFEMFFYLMFSLAMRWLNESQLPAALVAWAVLVAVGNRLIGIDQAPALQLVFSPLILEFIAGCLVALSVPRLGPRAGLICLLLGIAGIVAATVALDHPGVIPPEGWERVGLYGTASVAIVTGVVGLETEGWRLFPRAGVALGDASYSLYLSHMLVVAAMGHVWAVLLASPSPTNHVAALAVTFGLTILFGVLSFRLIEMPMLRYIRARVQRAGAVRDLWSRAQRLRVGGN